MNIWALELQRLDLFIIKNSSSTMWILKKNKAPYERSLLNQNKRVYLGTFVGSFAFLKDLSKDLSKVFERVSTVTKRYLQSRFSGALIFTRF